jgi:hypothetical protein
MFPIVRRSLELMDEMGMIELPLKVNGLEVTVVPQSPLAMANNAERLGEIMQFMQISQALGPVGQTLIKMDAVGDYIADQLGIPADLRTTLEERAEMQAQMAEAAAMMAEQEMGGAPPTEAPQA